jgi:hypothetical protein
MKYFKSYVNPETAQIENLLDRKHCLYLMDTPVENEFKTVMIFEDVKGYYPVGDPDTVEKVKGEELPSLLFHGTKEEARKYQEDYNKNSYGLTPEDIEDLLIKSMVSGPEDAETLMTKEEFDYLVIGEKMYWTAPLHLREDGSESGPVFIIKKGTWDGEDTEIHVRMADDYSSNSFIAYVTELSCFTVGMIYPWFILIP